MKFKKALLLLLVAVTIVFFSFSDVLPRAGGGQNYVPPSRDDDSSSYDSGTTDSSSSYDSGDTDSSGSYDSSNYDSGSTDSGYRGSGSGTQSGCGCCVFAIIIGVFILVAIIDSFKKKKNQGGDNKRGGGFIPKGQSPAGGKKGAYPDPQNPQGAGRGVDMAKLKEQMEELKKKDPNFSEKVFLDKAQTSFFHIQRAWSKNDLAPARAYMSEAQYSRMDMQLEEYRDKGWFNKFDNLVVGGIRITEAGVEGEHDFIKTEIRASMADYTVDRQGNMVDGSKEITPFREYWTFIRKQGAKTSQDGGKTVAHNCPNCGAPIESGGESGKCGFCDTVITASSFDWVLDTITQPIEEENW